MRRLRMPESISIDGQVRMTENLHDDPRTSVKMHQPSRIREEISARMSRQTEATPLQVPPGVPIIEVLHTSLTDDGAPFDVTRLILRAEVMRPDYTMPIEE